MRQIVGIVVFVPLAVIVGVFAVENRAPLTLEVWPLPGVHQMWASVWILGLLAVGIVLGLTIGWMAGSGARRRARRAERLNRTYERQLAERETDPVPAPARDDVSSAALPSPSARAARSARIED